MGTKVACSTSLTLCPYARIVSLSCFLKHWSRVVLRFEGAKGLKTLTSIRVLSRLLPQRPLAATLSLAPMVVFALLLDMVSVHGGLS